MMNMEAKSFGLASAAVILSGLLSGCMLMHLKGDGCMGGHGDGHAAAEVKAVCPVCGNRIAVSSNTVQAAVGGKIYYFDNEDHQREFVLDPDKFLRDKTKGDRTGDSQ